MINTVSLRTYFEVISDFQNCKNSKKNSIHHSLKRITFYLTFTCFTHLILKCLHKYFCFLKTRTCLHTYPNTIIKSQKIIIDTLLPYNLET